MDERKEKLWNGNNTYNVLDCRSHQRLGIWHLPTDAELYVHTERLKQLFVKAYPQKDLSVLLCLDSHARLCALDFLDHAAQIGCDKLYAYLFAYEFPYFGGMPAWHGAEVPFVFHNADCIPLYHEKGITRWLENQVASAWVQFAHTGSPNHQGMVPWHTYQLNSKATMVLDQTCALKIDFDRELVELVQQAAPWFQEQASP